VRVDKAGPATVTAGQPVTYTITATNNGPSNATSVVITDDIPVGLTFVSATGGTCAAVAGTVTCNPITVVSGGVSAVSMTFAVDPSVASGTAVTNTANVTAAETDPDPSNNTATNGTTVATIADLQTVKAGPATATAGGQVTYTVTVTNNGPSNATDVTITDPVPVGLTFQAVGSTAGCSFVPPPGPGANASVQCAAQSVASGGSAIAILVFDVDASVADGTVITNTASATGTETDPNPANNTNTVNTTIDTSVDLEISKTTVTNPVVAGQTVEWQLLVNNLGLSDATGIVLTDALPPNAVVDVASTDPRCAVNGAGDTVTCSLATLATGATDTFTIQATVGADQTADLINSVTGATDQPDPDPANNTAATTDPVGTSASVSLIKRAITDPLVPGSPAIWELEVTNTGPSDALNVEVTDTFPGALTYLDASSDPACDPGGAAGTVQCALGTLAAGATVIVSVSFNIDPATADGAAITNSASVSSDTPDPDNSDNSATATGTASRLADLVVAKTGSVTAVAGGQATYTVTVTNSGPSDAADVVITDVLPAGMTLDSFSTTLPGCANTPGSLNCSIGTLAVGATATVDLIVDVEPNTADAAVLANQATATTSTTDPDPTSNSSVVNTTIARSADLELTKQILTSPVVAGAPVLFELSVTNLGSSDASGVAISDPLPAGATFRVNLSSASCSEAGGIVTCALGDLPANQSGTVTIGVDLDPAAIAGGTISNSASVTSNETDPEQTNNSTSASAPITRSTNLAVDKQGPALPVSAGTPFTWTLSVTNNGPSDATGVVLLDDLPNQASFNAGASDPRCVAGAPGALTTPITCTVGDLAFGATTAIDLVVDLGPSVAAGALVANNATITANEDDPTPVDNSSTNTVSVERTSGLTVAKTDVADPVVAGETIAWDIMIENLGPSTSDDVVATDMLPPGTSFVAADSDAACLADPTDPSLIVCQVGTLTPGAQQTLRIVAALDENLADGIQLTNTVTVTGDDSPDATAVEETTVDRSVELAITKTSDTSPIVPGSPFVYLLTVTNNGPSEAANVTVQDTLPANVTITEARPTANCTVAAGTVTCVFPTLAAGASIQIEMDATPASLIADGTTIQNGATATSDETDSDPTNNTATSAEPAVRSVDVTMTKTAAAEEVEAGSNTSFTLSVTNLGPSDATGVLVTDTLPAGLTFDPTASAASCTQTAPGTIECAIGDLSAGETTDVVIAVIVDPGLASGALVNLASVATEELNTGDPNTTETVTVTEFADLALTKTGPATVIAGTEAQFTFTVQNLGPSVARNVVITDTLPPGLTAGTLPANCQASADGATVTCAMGDVAVGETPSLVVGLLVDPSQRQAVLNTAQVGSDAGDVDPSNNVGSAQFDIDAEADLVASKRLASGTLFSGGQAIWEIGVTNLGPSTATDAVLTDSLPPGLTFAPTGSGVDCTANGSEVSCQLGNIAVGETVTRTIVTDVSLEAVGQIENTVSATSAERDPNPATSTAAVGADIARANATLTVEKTVVSAEFEQGGQIVWQIVVTNEGPDPIVSPIEIVDVLPSDLAYVTVLSAKALCPGAGQTISCTVDGLAAGESVTLDITTQNNGPIAAVENPVTVRVGGLATGTGITGIVEVAASAIASRPDGVLAFTGANTLALGSLGLALLAGGALLTATTRRRRRTVG